MRNCQIIFHSGWTILHSHWQCTSVPISPHPCQHLIFSTKKIIAVLGDVKWYLVVILICIFLMTIETGHLFMCLLDIFFRKCLFKSCVHLKFSYILLLSCQEFFVCSRCKSFVGLMIYKYFLPFCGLPFHGLDVLWSPDI